MGLLGKVVVILLAAAIAYVWRLANQVPPLPVLERTYWGPGKPHKYDDNIRPFKISVSNQALDNLNNRLENHAPLTPPLEGINFEYGFNTDYLKKVVDFWKKDYKWREREIFLNQFPQFKTRVAGLDLHYIHMEPSNYPEGTRVLPLLLLHGWPGSIREFYSLIPMLTTPRKGVDFVFEVIAPSLPGYGFSQGSSKPGLGPAEIGVIMDELMERVGHNRYYVQGGDWGSGIGSFMSNLFPNKVIGLHVNMCSANNFKSRLKFFVGSFFPSLVVDAEYAHLMYPFSEKFVMLLEESGYMHLQATKPDTVGVALTDSPVGLAAYILEKFSSWTDMKFKKLPDGGLSKYAMTDLLDNVMLYWASGSITTSMRLYSEYMNKRAQGMGLEAIPSTVPTGCAAFPNDLLYQSESLVREKFPNLVRMRTMPRGGHFAAFEEPKMLADDVWETVEIIEKLPGSTA